MYDPEFRTNAILFSFGVAVVSIVIVVVMFITR